jgi:hypothetical protein
VRRALTPPEENATFAAPINPHHRHDRLGVAEVSGHAKPARGDIPPLGLIGVSPRFAMSAPDGPFRVDVLRDGGGGLRSLSLLPHSFCRLSREFSTGLAASLPVRPVLRDQRAHSRASPRSSSSPPPTTRWCRCRRQPRPSRCAGEHPGQDPHRAGAPPVALHGPADGRRRLARYCAVASGTGARTGARSRRKALAEAGIGRGLANYMAEGVNRPRRAKVVTQTDIVVSVQ